MDEDGRDHGHRSRSDLLLRDIVTLLSALLLFGQNLMRCPHCQLPLLPVSLSVDAITLDKYHIFVQCNCNLLHLSMARVGLRYYLSTFTRCWQEQDTFLTKSDPERAAIYLALGRKPYVSIFCPYWCAVNRSESRASFSPTQLLPLTNYHWGWET